MYKILLSIKDVEDAIEAYVVKGDLEELVSNMGTAVVYQLSGAPPHSDSIYVLMCDVYAINVEEDDDEELLMQKYKEYYED